MSPTEDDVCVMSATALAEGLRRRQISSRELLTAYLDRISSAGPLINAVVTIDPDRAMEAAVAADKASAAGRFLGPLHGLPVTIKDSIETAGLRTTCGAEELSAYIPERDADAVARLRSAGAIIFGKTNVPTYVRDLQTTNPLFGQTRNPRNPDRTAGGSSGGPAAAVAAGMTAIDLGSDLAGSLRLPASYCGVFGLRPSGGLVPARGHIPRVPGSLVANDMVTIGPVTRAAADLNLVLDVIAGPDAAHANAWTLELPPPRADELRDYRIGLWLDDSYCAVDADVTAVLESAVSHLTQAGCRFDRINRPVAFPESDTLFQHLMFGATSLGVPDAVFRDQCAAADRLERDDNSPAARFLRGTTQRLRDWHRADEQRQQLRAQWARYFQAHDVLLTPTCPTVAVPHDTHADPATRTLVVNGEDRSYWDQTTWLGLASVAYLPAATVPVGRDPAGLPVGLHIIGPYLEDRTVIDVADRISTLLGASPSLPR